MTAFLPPDVEELLQALDAPLRRLKRAEYEALARNGAFDDERVELLYGLVVPMSPNDQVHGESVRLLTASFIRQLGDRANVYGQSSFAASEESVPEPDLYLTSMGLHWSSLHTRAHLVVEVAVSSLRRDRAKRKLYARAEITEYWIVNHVDRCIEVYRDRVDNDWATLFVVERGEIIAPLAFPDVEIAVDAVLPPLAS